MQQPRVVVVMGVSGSGKSTVAAALAATAGGKFFDADDFHPDANVAKMASGVPLDDADRWPWLAELKARVIDTTPPGSLAVLACSALKKSYRERLGTGHDGVALVYLKGTRETLAKRMQARHGHYMKAAMLDSQLEVLEAPSAEEGIAVGIDRPVDEIVAEIVSLLNLRARG